MLFGVYKIGRGRSVRIKAQVVACVARELLTQSEVHKLQTYSSGRKIYG